MFINATLTLSNLGHDIIHEYDIKKYVVKGFFIQFYHYFEFFDIIFILSSKIRRVFSGYNQKKTQRNLCRFLGLTSSGINYLQSTFLGSG
jgi:hypothetical protein